MITLTLADYAIITIVCLAVTLRIISDIRDVLEAKFIKNTMKILGGRTFSPKLTVVIPLESLENTKQTLEHLSVSNLTFKVIVVIDSKIQPRAASPLRYFVRTHAMKQVSVTARKNPNLSTIAAQYAKTGLVGILSDTSRLQTSFSQDVILPFADQTVDAVQILSTVRTDKTLGSGIEVLFTMWRRYIGLNSFSRSTTMTSGRLPEGVIIRAKLLRKPPKRKLHSMLFRRPLYSIAAQKNIRSTLSKLQKSAGPTEFWTVLAIAASMLLLLNISYSSMLVTNVFALVYILLAWWSLSAARVALIDRISVVLLAPFFIIIAIILITAQIAKNVAPLLSKIKAGTTKLHIRSRAALGRP